MLPLIEYLNILDNTNPLPSTSNTPVSTNYKPQKKEVKVIQTIIFHAKPQQLEDIKLVD